MTLRRLGELLARQCAFDGCNRGDNGENKLFIPTRTNERYCCVECRNTAGNRNRQPRTKEAAFHRVVQGVVFRDNVWWDSLAPIDKD